MRLIEGLGTVFAALALNGCIGVTATPAVQGKAYVVKGSIFGTTVYNCDATSGEPRCWEVKETELEEEE